MKFLRMFLAVLIAVMFISCKEGEDAKTGGENVAAPADKITVAPFTVDLAGLNNLVVQSAVNPDLSVSYVNYASYSGGNLFTNSSGALIEVVIPTGLSVKKVYDIEGSSNIAISFYVDSTDDTQHVVTCVLDDLGLCDPLEYEPRKLSNLGNSPYFQKVGTDILHLEANNLIQASMVSGLSKSVSLSTIQGVVSQISINSNGHMMIDNGTQIRLSAVSDIIIPDTEVVSNSDYMAELFPNVKKYFIPHKGGFLVKGGINNDFYRISENNGTLDIRFTQHNAYDQYVNVGGGFNRIFNMNGLSGCTANIVQDEDIMICQYKVYNLGDASNDIEEYEFNWFEHNAIYDRSAVIILADNNFIYFFSGSDVGSGKLTRVDFKNTQFSHIFASPGPTYNILSGSINGDVYRGCTENSILEIANVSTAPIITETTGECSQIVSF